MRVFLLLIAFALTSPTFVKAAGSVRIQTSWDIDVTEQNYRNSDTGIRLTKNIASFRLKEATPAASDSSAEFFYLGKKGLIHLYHQPRALVGVRNPAAYVEAQSAAMEKGNGKFDSKSFFALAYNSGSKTGSGNGVVYHFIHSPELYGKQIWDAFGCVQIGEFFFVYRASFLDKTGLDDLSGFLRVIGIRKA